jgi:PAS domain S-box-containing protein
MNIFDLQSLIAFLVALFLGNFVYFKNPKDRLNRIFMLLCLFNAYASFVDFEFRRAHNYETALFWARAGAFWWVIIPLLLHFVLIFTEHAKLLKKKITYILMYGPALLFSLVDLTTFLATGKPTRAYGGWTFGLPDNSLFLNLSLIWTSLMIIITIYFCLNHFVKTTDYRKRQQTKYVLIGVAIPLVYGLFQFVLYYYNIQVPDIITTTVIIAIIFIGYAIWRYELFILTPLTAAQGIIDTMSDSLFLVDPEGHITVANHAALRLLGYEENELINKPVEMIFEENDIEKIFRGSINQELLREGFLSDVETSFKSKDCRNIPISLSCSLIQDKDGRQLGIIYVGRDITKRKLTEEELKKYQDHLEGLVEERTRELMEVHSRLQRAEKMEAIGTLAGGVAHDLNNILSGIINYPELLLLEISGDNPIRKPILTIQKSGEKAAAIVQDLLTLARRGIVVTEVLNLNHTISDYLKSPERERLTSFHPNVEIETDLSDDLLNIVGSPVHLSKTVMNLVSNAAEAMLHGGKILMSTENRYIDKPIRGYEDLKEGDYVTLAVSDTGIGIPDKDLDRIFEPFYTKKVMGRSGTGLGMAVIWGTVKDHNGYIDVHSAEGQGTTFTLYFPATREKSVKDRSQISVDDYTGSGESILVVDDVFEQREIVSAMLNKLGYSVQSVSSGEEAVDYLKNNEADLLVLDMIMDPGIDGFETYRKILELHPKQKAIIASGFSETDRVKEAQKLGAGQYIRKPFTLEKLGLAVKEELEK